MELNRACRTPHVSVEILGVPVDVNIAFSTTKLHVSGIVWGPQHLENHPVLHEVTRKRLPEKCIYICIYIYIFIFR